MPIASRTPEGWPNRCPTCGAEWRIEPSQPTGDAPCPVCGQLVWFDPDGVEQRVREILTRNFGIRSAGMSGGSSFVTDLGADSLDVVEVIMELEEEFGVSMPDEAAERLRTIDDVIEYIVRQIREKRGED
jgi:acyl carrier protein